MRCDVSTVAPDVACCESHFSMERYGQFVVRRAGWWSRDTACGVWAWLNPMPARECVSLRLEGLSYTLADCGR